MRKIGMYAAISVIGLAGYFISNEFSTSVKDSQSFEVERSPLSLKSKFSHDIFKCNHDHNNVLTQADIDKYNSFLRKALDTDLSHTLELEDLPDCPLKNELSEFENKDIVKKYNERCNSVKPSRRKYLEFHGNRKKSH